MIMFFGNRCSNRTRLFSRADVLIVLSFKIPENSICTGCRRCRDRIRPCPVFPQPVLYCAEFCYVIGSMQFRQHLRYIGKRKIRKTGHTYVRCSCLADHHGLSQHGGVPLICRGCYIDFCSIFTCIDRRENTIAGRIVPKGIAYSDSFILLRKTFNKNRVQNPWLFYG